MTLNHDQLAESLAAHLRANTDSVVWTNMQMGPSGSARPDQLRALHTRVENEQYAKVQAARRMQEGQCSEYLERIARALGCEAQDAVDRLGLVCNLMTGVDWRDPIRKALDGMQAASQALQLVHSLIRGGASIQQDSGTVTAAPAVSTQVVDCGAAAQTRTGDLLITNQIELSPESSQEQALSGEDARAGDVEKGESDQGRGQTLQQGETHG